MIVQHMAVAGGGGGGGGGDKGGDKGGEKITIEEYYERKYVFERFRSFRYGVV